jgi:hypothetical protein
MGARCTFFSSLNFKFLVSISHRVDLIRVGLTIVRLAADVTPLIVHHVAHGGPTPNV